jgi:hypothetical protein
VAIDGANRNDSILLAPTLDDAAKLGLLKDIETLWLDRGYDSEATIERLVEREINNSVIAKKRKKGEAKAKNPQPIGDALAGRADQQLALEFREAPSQHRPQCHTPTGSVRPRRCLLAHGQAHRLA